MDLLSYFTKKTFDGQVSQDEQCKELIARIENDYNLNLKPLTLKNLSSYLLIDMLERIFSRGDITDLPEKINVLDVGTGEWYYAPALLNFFKFWNGSRQVCLEGVDFPQKDHQKSIRKLCKNWDLKIHWGDVMDLKEHGRYDIIFMAHMLTGPRHFKKFKVPYCPPSSMFPKMQSLGKTNGLFIVTAYEWAGEASILNCFENKLAEINYNPRVGENLSDAIEGCQGFHDNVACLFRDPYVNLPACRKREKDKEEWDKIMSKFDL